MWNEEHKETLNLQENGGDAFDEDSTNEQKKFHDIFSFCRLPQNNNLKMTQRIFETMKKRNAPKTFFCEIVFL